MITMYRRDVSLMVMCCISLHLTWALLLFVDGPSAAGATAMASLHYVIPDYMLLAGVFALVAYSAGVALFCRWPWICWLLLPQQIALMLSASGAIAAMYLGQYADGVPRPHAFVTADQVLVVLATFWHTVAIISHVHRNVV
jgi:hypothetical protein